MADPQAVVTRITEAALTEPGRNAVAVQPERGAIDFLNTIAVE